MFGSWSQTNLHDSLCILLHERDAARAYARGSQQRQTLNHRATEQAALVDMLCVVNERLI